MTPGRFSVQLLGFVVFSSLFIFPAIQSAQAQLAGGDASPGQSCAGKPAGSVTMVADADQNGADVVLVCDGTVWKPPGVKVANDAGACSSAKDGVIRYNSATSPAWNYCNGSAWVPFEHAAFGGFLVQTSQQYRGDLLGQDLVDYGDGLAGANAACLANLTANNWMNKSLAGTLNSTTVKAFLCDGTTCNQAKPNMFYLTAVAGSPALGGTGFTTDGVGRGFGHQLYMDDSNFEGSRGYWSNRGTVSASVWGTSPAGANHCSNWSSTAGNGVVGNMANNNAARWQEVTFACNTNRYLMCLVNASFNATVVGGFAGFSDLVDQSVSTLVSSNILQVIIPGTSTISISGSGSPQYRTCQDTACSSVITNWTNVAGTVTQGNFVQLRLTTSASNFTALSATVDVSGTSDNWTVTTAHDLTPDAFAFTMLTSQAASSTITSNIVLVSGVTTAVNVTVSGGGSPQYRTCNDAACSSVLQNWTSTAGTIANNKYLQLRTTTPASGTNTITVSAGTVTQTWYVSTNGKGYFVLSSSGSTGSLGGRSGANATCLSNLTAGSWLGKGSATLDAAHVFSFLCDGTACNNLNANTIYQFARSGSGTVGGDVFVTDASGRGPGATGAWSGSTQFGVTTRFWSSRASGTSTLWATTGQANHCSNWSNGTGSFNGVRGDPTETADRRWADSSESCASNRNLVCFVNP